MRERLFTIARANSHASCTPRGACSQIGGPSQRHQHDPQLGQQSRTSGGGRRGAISELTQREGKLRDKTAQRSHTRGSDPPHTHPAVSCPKREPHTRRTHTWRGQPTLEQQAEPALTACRGQPHGAPLTWTFQPAILAERGPSAPSGMRPPAAARLAGCGGAMGAALPVDGSSAQQGAGGAAAGPGEGPA